MKAIPHGTRHGYDRCRTRPEGSCEACRAANREYLREHRRISQRVRERETVRRAARDRAYARLRRNHPEEFQALLFLEMREPRREGSAA